MKTPEEIIDEYFRLSRNSPPGDDFNVLNNILHVLGELSEQVETMNVKQALILMEYNNKKNAEYKCTLNGIPRVILRKFLQFPNFHKLAYYKDWVDSSRIIVHL